MTKKNDKEMNCENRWEKWLTFCILLGVLGVIIFAGINFNSTDYICSRNPEKCVYEPNKKFFNQYPSARYNQDALQHYNQDALQHIQDFCRNANKRWEACSFRLKTPSELLIDDCNNNSREDEKCKCEEYDEDIADLRDIEINETKAKDMNIDLEETSLSECFEFKICGIPHNICLKSRPKTEQEKHPDDYIVETQYIEIEDIDYSRIRILSNLVLIDMQFDELHANVNILNWYMSNVRIPKELCASQRNESFFIQNTKVNLTICLSQYYPRRIINQTTYRLKNECEKETKCISTKEILENYTTHELKCPKIIDNPTDIVIEYIPCSSELVNFTVYHFVKKEICVENQTICREKTDVENLTDSKCDDLKWRITTAKIAPSFKEEYIKSFIQMGCKI